MKTANFRNHKSRRVHELPDELLTGITPGVHWISRNLDIFKLGKRISYVPLESGRNVFAQPPLPRTAMEQSGHAQVPTLLVALVRRQAGRAGWKAEITYENKEEWKFQKEKRHQFKGVAFQNIFKGCLYLFIRQHGFFRNTREHKTSTTL